VNDQDRKEIESEMTVDRAHCRKISDRLAGPCLQSQAKDASEGRT